MNTHTIETLITFLDLHPNVLYDSLNSSYRWDIIDTFILDTYHPEHWNMINNYSRDLLSFPTIKHWITYLGIIQILEIYSITSIATFGIAVRIDTVGNISNIVSIYTIIYNINSEVNKILFIQQTSEYILQEIRIGNISPEFIELLYKIFQL